MNSAGERSVRARSFRLRLARLRQSSRARSSTLKFPLAHPLFDDRHGLFQEDVIKRSHRNLARLQNRAAENFFRSSRLCSIRFRSRARQLLQIERLRDVVVGTGFKPFNLAVCAGAGGQKNHRDMACPQIPLQMRQSSIPSRSGIMTSLMTMSGTNSSARSNPAFPFGASYTA